MLSLPLILAGCVSAGAATGDPATDTRTVSALDSVESDNGRVRSLENTLQAREARIEDLQSQLANRASGVDSSLFPPDAKPGQCYARILTEEKYRTWEERVLVKDESESVQIIPARYQTAQERVLVKEASSRIETVPAEYEMVAERVLVKPASISIIEVPATFRTVTEQVLDKPAYTVWKRGPATSFSDPVKSQSVNATGEVMCLVEVPATYKTITRKIVDVAAHTKEVEVPAEYKTVEKRVVKRPATTREVEIPAEYQSVEVRKLVEPGTQRRTKNPAEYQTVVKSEKIADAKLAWQPVLCEVNATPSNIVALQRALEAQGYGVGPIDGVLGAQTISAVSKFATQKGIPHGANYVPIDVLKALNLKI